jgi:alcohol dehydrogenase class IV
MSPTTTSTFTFPNRIVFGEGSSADLPAELAQLGVKRPLIVTDAGLVASGMVAKVAGPLGDIPVFDRVQPNPTEADVLAGLDLYRTKSCDGVVGLGGGSPIDCAKAIRLLATHLGRLVDYDFTTGGLDKITPNLPPMAAIPTTAGTGSEAGRGALIQLPQNGRKTIALSPHLLPSVAICDPTLVLGLPPELTAGTGMDAVSHCVESYLSTMFHPICDGIALQGLKHLAKGLETSVADGRNLRARRECLMGSLLGGISFHKGLGVIHALSHALGAEGRAHHGTINAILLPHAIRFNREAAEARMLDLASALGLGRGGDAHGHLITLAELLLIRFPLPRRLDRIDGLRHDRIPEYARLALLDHCHRTNPRPCTQADLEDLLDRAW